jgi:hypothetical protein
LLTKDTYKHGFISAAIGINKYRYMAMKRIMLSVSQELYEAIEYERQSRKLETVPETARAILSEFFRDKID